MSENDKDKWENGGPVLGGWEVDYYAREAEEDWKNAKGSLIGFVIFLIIVALILGGIGFCFWLLLG